jgi:glycerol-3-phosphate dehydrogenase
MIRDTPALEKTEFDLVVVGAGITGAFLAHDAALRGLKVAIIDKSDFGAATSSASSKLLHGGIRYLQQGRLNKVRESAKERVFFQIIAPHLTRYVPFVVPARKG